MTAILIRAGKAPWVAISPESTLEGNVLGTNAGNALFSTSVFAALSTSDNELAADYFQVDRTVDVSAVARRIDEEYDHVVVPMANAFRPSYLRHLRRWTRVIEHLSIPVTIVGVGGQFAFDDDALRASPDVEQATREFVAAALDHGPKVGVRGSLTAEFLNRLGFGAEHVEVIGCPSLYRPDLNVGVRSPRSQRLPHDARVAVHIHYALNEAMPKVQRWLGRALENYPNLEYIAQENRDLRHLLWGEGFGQDRVEGLPRDPDHPLLAEDRTRFFVDERTWREYLADFDFVVGNRIHGTVAGVLAGVPSLVLPWDSRTSELAEVHGLPSVPLSAMEGDESLADLYEKADFEAFHRRHPDNQANYARFLHSHSLTTTFTDSEPGMLFRERMQSVWLPGPVNSVLAGKESRELSERLTWLRWQVAEAARTGVSRHYPSWTEARRKLTLRQLEERLTRLENRPSSPTIVAPPSPWRRLVQRVRHLARRARERARST